MTQRGTEMSFKELMTKQQQQQQQQQKKKKKKKKKRTEMTWTERPGSEMSFSVNRHTA